MDRRVIFLKAPPAPRCFESRSQWVEFLSSAQAAGKVLPFKGGEYRPEFQFCSDCSAQHAHAMHLQGRCDPNTYRANLMATAPATAEAHSTSADAVPAGA
jgi:hypothetical protein